MNEMIRNNLDPACVPTVEEARAMALHEPDLFPAPEQITEDWILRSQVYQVLFGEIFRERTGAERLEQRIAARGFLPASADRRRFFQKFDRLGLQYLYVRGTARVERLSPEAQELLTRVHAEPSEDNLEAALQMVRDTFPTVMAVAPERPETTFEPIQTLHGDYRILGKSIPLALRSVAEFLPDGALKSEEAELDRLRVFSTIVRQLDPAFSEDLGCSTKTVLEVFDV